MPNFVVVCGKKYYGKHNDNSGAKFKCRDRCYGKQLNITFDSPEEFKEKVLAEIPDHIKAEFFSDENIPNRVLTVEDEVVQLKEDIKEVKISTNNRFYSVESKVESNITNIAINTVSIEFLQSENEQLRLLIQQLQENDRIQSDKIVSLENRVSEVESENVDLRKDVSSLQRTVSKHENEISDRRREIVYINKLRDEEAEDREYIKQQQLADYEYRKRNRVVGVMTTNGPKTYEELYTTNKDTEWFPKYCTSDDLQQLRDSTIDTDVFNKVQKQMTEYTTSVNTKLEEMEEETERLHNNQELVFNKINESDSKVDNVSTKLDKTIRNVKKISNKSTQNLELLKLTHQERQRVLNNN